MRAWVFTLLLTAFLSLFAGFAEAAAPVLTPEQAATNPLVQNNLAVIYAEGQGVPQDYQKAAEWFKKAALQGDAFAQASLAYLYAQGHGVKKDFAKAALWYYKAAIQGDAKSEYHLATLYYLGVGVPKDYEQAVTWFSRAAGHGDRKAQYYLQKITYHPAPDPAAPLAASLANDEQHSVANGIGVVFLQGAGAGVGFEAALFWILLPLLAFLAI